MFSSLPLDVFNGGCGSYVDEIKNFFPDLQGERILSPDAADKLHDNDFSMIVIRKGGENKQRLFPRFDPLHGLSSLVNLMKNRHMINDSITPQVTKRIIIALPKEYANTDFVKKITSSLGVNLENPEAVEEFCCPSCGEPLTMNEDEIPPGITVKESHYIPQHYMLKTSEACYQPIDTLEQIKEACHFLNDEGRQMDPRAFQQAYSNTVNRMLQVGLHPKTAGLEDVQFGNYVNTELEKRAELLSSPEDKNVFLSLRGRYEETTPLKFASLLTTLDETYGFDKLYSRRFVNVPLEAITMNVKTASTNLIHNDPQTGYQVHEYQLENAKKSKRFMSSIEKFLGKDVREAMEDDCVGTFKHLPDMHKNMIAKIVKDHSTDIVNPDEEKGEKEKCDSKGSSGSILIMEQDLSKK